MKKILQCLTFTLSLALFISCSNDSDNDLGPNNPPPENNDVTYSNTIKGIINGNCTSCHSNPPVNSAPIPLTTYTNVKEAVQNRGLIGLVESGAMPKNGNMLSAANIKAIKDWQTGGFLE